VEAVDFSTGQNFGDAQDDSRLYLGAYEQRLSLARKVTHSRQGIWSAKWNLLSRTLLGHLLRSGRCQIVGVLGVQFRGLGGVMNCVLVVSVGKVRVVRSLFVLLRLVVFRRLFVMVGRPLTGSVMVMLPSL